MNGKSIVFGSVVLSLSTVLAGAPTVTGVSMEKAGNGRAMTVSYTLEGDEDAIVTLDVLTNGVSVGANVTYLVGEINKRVSPGTYRVTWRPDKERWDGLPASAIDLGDSVSVSVSAWTLDDPPPYRVFNLLSRNMPVRYYASEDALPGGISDRCYREHKLIMRRIPAKDVMFRMGASTNETDKTERYASDRFHYVTLTQDYYMGVFEITQGQYKYLADSNPSEFGKFADSYLRPVDKVPYDSLRGSTAQGIDWPTTARGVVAEGSALDELQQLTGVAFDLPTEAEWEYACRAGTGTACNLGCPVYNNAAADAAGFGTAAWYVYNFRGNPLGDGSRPVGTKLPNAWGLYDMHGNIPETCLDWVDLSVEMPETPVTAPVGLQTGTRRACRGGNWGDFAEVARSGARSSVDPSVGVGGGSGFRVVCPLGDSW